jgi:hypothetical protein
MAKAISGSAGDDGMGSVRSGQEIGARGCATPVVAYLEDIGLEEGSRQTQEVFFLLTLGVARE